MTKTYTVTAEWDADAKIWWTNGEDIPGLTVQADSFEELASLVLELGPEMLRDNVKLPVGTQVAITIVAQRHGTTCIAA